MLGIAGELLPPPQNVGDLRAELNHSAPDRFIRNVRAPFQRQFLDFAQAQVEPGV